MELFGREATLTIGGAKIVASVDKTDPSNPSRLRFVFRVSKSLSADPNTCEIRIYNLSQATRARLQEKGIEVTLEAGYKANSQIIFKGTTARIEHRHEGPDWESKLACGDGEKKMREEAVSLSFKAGTTVQEVAKKVGEAMKLSVGNLPQKLAAFAKEGKGSFANGLSIDGLASKAFDKIAEAAGLTWSVQDGALQVLKDDEAVAGPPLLVTSSQLIGQPESGEKSDKAKEKGPTFRAKVLLEPGLRPGRAVTLQSKAVQGTFRIEKVEHSGDTWGQEWYSVFEGKPIQT